MSAFPSSLLEAIASFFIANAVRDLRGHEKTHRTMMVNISRFISVQNQIADSVDAFVRNAQREIQNYYRLGDAALEYNTFKLLKRRLTNILRQSLALSFRGTRFSWY